MNEDGDLTQLQTMAITMHELFDAYVQAGFTRPEAMDLLITIIEQGRFENGG
jgi:hypothetical protein